MTYKALPYTTIARNAIVNRRNLNRPTSVSLQDPATRVMTDFRNMTPYSIEQTASIDSSNSKMIACSVRLLFVTDSQNRLMGLVTASDVLGEKPVQYMKEHGGNRSDIMTRDIMTPLSQLDVLQISDVESASVGDIVETAKVYGRQHILVVEKNHYGESVRGLFSTTQISRQLGTGLNIAERANTFAELGKTIASA